MKRTAGLALVCVAAIFGLTGCQYSYSTLRFRPLDTSTQSIVTDVHVLVSHNGAGGIGGGVDRGATNEHGQLDLGGLQAGDVLTFVKPGYESTSIKLGLSSYRQSAPASSRDEMLYDLNDLDAIPVPLHREGNVVRPTTLPN